MKKSIFIMLLVLMMLTAVCAGAETTVIRMTCGGDALLGCNELVRNQGYEYSYDRYIDEYGYGYPLPT